MESCEERSVNIFEKCSGFSKLGTFLYLNIIKYVWSVILKSEEIILSGPELLQNICEQHITMVT